MVNGRRTNKKGNRPALSDHTVNQIIKLSKTHTPEEVVEKLGVSRHSVYKYRCDM